MFSSIRGCPLRSRREELKRGGSYSAASINATRLRGLEQVGFAHYSNSKPWLSNFRVRLFSVTVRTDGIDLGILESLEF
jgi:hypothetical protein